MADLALAPQPQPPIDSLSARLKGVDAAAARMRAPLAELRDKVAGTAARELLELLLDTSHVVSKVEKLIKELPTAPSNSLNVEVVSVDKGYSGNGTTPNVEAGTDVWCGSFLLFFTFYVDTISVRRTCSWCFDEKVLVMLPLRRPDLFKGGLLKPCRGILLFGPPGTGKTMLAKAIENDAGASFINVSMSTITSKWFGEDEKNVRALFSLAAKVAPTIIFVDEVDSMLGQRARCGEHEAMRKIKNEFMSHWDGLLSKSGERILVLAATNRPFDK